MPGKKVLIVGGGASGIKAALSEADAGNRVYLLEHFPGMGGKRIPQDRIIGIDDTWEAPDMDVVKSHENIQIITQADVQSLVKKNGRFEVTVHWCTARVDPKKCDDCGECIKVCPIHMYDDYNEGLEWRTAIDFFDSEWRAYNIFKEDMPVCQRTCPLELDIRTYVGQIADRDYAGSLATIRKKLPFPLSIGRICPHPCEGACNRGYKDEPISICFLKRFVADYEVVHPVRPKIELPQVRYPEKIAIIGAGPSGLTCAYHLARFGYENVTVLEALPEPGGMFLVGIPEYRLPKAILAEDMAWIERHGVVIKTGIRVGEDISFDDLRQENDAVLIAVGAHRGMSMGVANEDAAGVYEGVKFLRDAALANEVPHEGTALVVGGGNVAMDVARTCMRIGFDGVNILYRRTRKEMPASPWEIDAAEEEGVRFHFLVAPQEVVTHNGKAAGLRCVKMELGEPDMSGRRRPVPIESSAFVIEGDAVFAAIGQVTDNTFVQEVDGFRFGRKLNFEVNPDTWGTNVDGVFASGDAATGASIAIKACAGGKKAAESIHQYLRSKT